MKYFLTIVCQLIFTATAIPQPGPMPEELYFNVFSNGKNVLESMNTAYEMQWRNSSDYKNNWSLAIIENNQFKTGKVKKHRGATEIKIYKKLSTDTMFITCHDNINNIPFQKGTFVIDKSTNYLVNMQTFNGVTIVNQQWNNYKTNNNNIQYLTKNRYCYYSKASAPHEEDEQDVVYKSYKKSAHLIEEKEEAAQEYISLGKLYYAPKSSGSVYSIGYVTNEIVKGEKYAQYFLESTDFCQSWKIKFPLHDNNADLINIINNNFIISNAYPSNQLLAYNAKGNITDSIAIDDEPCANERNIFFNCNKEIAYTNNTTTSASNPLKGDGAYQHIFIKEFYNGINHIRIDELPYYPKSISVAFGKEAQWKKAIELNSKETYVYLTARKNKIVVVSYNYTLTSNDFGKTWTFYNNGTFENGEWNFIWLDDNTLVNVTNYYADYFTIP